MTASRRVAAVPDGILTPDVLRTLDGQAVTAAGKTPSDQQPGDPVPSNAVPESFSDSSPTPETPASPRPPFGVVPGMAAVLHGIWRWEPPRDVFEPDRDPGTDLP
ncbi:hypothetical protein [Streptosporangium sp. NPDC051022]|uniref:hypothetical protein n=1 Tax=Streptosporangium sp. NPDC051022 TaxID=3155752 RepID=UPI003442DEE7